MNDFRNHTGLTRPGGMQAGPESRTAGDYRGVYGQPLPQKRRSATAAQGRAGVSLGQGRLGVSLGQGQPSVSLAQARTNVSADLAWSSISSGQARTNVFLDQAWSSISSGRTPANVSAGQARRRVRSAKRKRSKRKNKLPWILLLAVIIFLVLRNGLPDFLLPPRPKPQITGLHPVVAAKQAELVSLAAKKGIDVVITQGYRSTEEQDELYRQGRTAEGAIVTNAKGGQSYHNYGLAVDFAIKKPSGDVIWDMDYDGNRNQKPDWQEIVDIAKQLGFTWGGDWANFPDYSHLQMDFGYSLSKLQKGYYPPADAAP